MREKDALGRRGEQLAAEYLQQSGMRILDRNWRCSAGELDIVAVERQTLVVCEVKTRSGPGFGSPLEAVSQAKRRRLRRLAMAWREAHGVLFEEVRVDVVGLLADRSGTVTLEHVRGVA